jgi:hypothetical protein
MEKENKELVERVRAAIKDRAIWFALLYKTFREEIPEEKLERLARKAIRQFGILKAKKDPPNFNPKIWVSRHREKGSDLVFDSDVEYGQDSAYQIMKFCPLVEAWKEMGCSEEEIRLFCDIAMEGDRGRADVHRVGMELTGRLSHGDPCCRLRIYNLEAVGEK